MTSAPLELLLADATDLRPALDEGLPPEAAAAAQEDRRAPRRVDALTLEAPGADPNALPLQRWGVIAPEGPDGDAALDAIAPLLALREREQGAPAKRYRVRPDMDLCTSLEWKDEVLRDEDVPEAERPRYLLVLGDLDQVSADLQHVLANGSFVGRVHFAGDDGALDAARYHRYAEKVVAWADHPTGEEKPDALFFAARDRSRATAQGRALLVDPCHALATRARSNGDPLLAGAPVDVGDSAGSLLAAVKSPRPSVLLTLGHGLGLPGATPLTARRRQGALLLDEDSGDVLSADQVGPDPFLPGGFWFCVACFGAGTPRESTFYPWLSKLAEEGVYRERLSRVLACLPGSEGRPFLAALPQAMLAKRDGPLAIVAHLDLAWTYGFTDDGRFSQSRASRIWSSLRVAAEGHRAGVALDALMRAYREVNDELAYGYHAEEDARVWKRTYKVDPIKRGNAFMLRSDLRGYVLLGDPAVRLPLKGAAAARAPAAIPPGAEARGELEVARMEEAVVDLMKATETTNAIARRHKITREQLERWAREYRAAGRDRLAKLR
jgi:Helix-turn-helix domain